MTKQNWYTKNISTRLRLRALKLSKTKIPITIVKAQMLSNPNQKSRMRDNKGPAGPLWCNRLITTDYINKCALTVMGVRHHTTKYGDAWGYPFMCSGCLSPILANGWQLWNKWEKDGNDHWWQHFMLRKTMPSTDDQMDKRMDRQADKVNPV